MTGRILRIGTAFPAGVVPQDDVFTDFYRELYAALPAAKEIFANTQVRTRHMAWDPRTALRDGIPGLSARMQAWEEHVLRLGRECLTQVLSDAASVGTFVMASCTGYAGPTPELLLAKEFSLDERVRRTFIGHMGCYAAFNALKVALDALVARPGEDALVLCAEVCSVHLRTEATVEQAIVHALFGDGAAAVLLSAEDGGPALIRTHTRTHYETSAAMTWTVRDESFRMTLSPYVPVYLSRTIRSFVEELIEPAGLHLSDVRHWGIHPGGPKIIQLVGEQLDLDAAALAPSLRVLSERGNCSSATILLILEHLLAQRPRAGEYGVLMAFGPGLTLESALIRF
jgi:predicted naringenin-chalcone synthase